MRVKKMGSQERQRSRGWESPGEAWEWGQGRLGDEAKAQREARTWEAGVTPGSPSGWSLGVSAPNPRSPRFSLVSMQECSGGAQRQRREVRGGGITGQHKPDGG